MYGIFTKIYPINDPNVSKYTIHGTYGIYIMYIYIYNDKLYVRICDTPPTTSYLGL